MYLVGDTVNLPSSVGLTITGMIELVEEQPDGSLSYVINTEDGISIRNSNDDEEMSIVDDISVDFS